MPTTERDPETGRITKSYLSPEEARAMGARSRKSERQPDVADLLAELRLSGSVAETLADQAVKGGGGGVAAVKELMKMSGIGTAAADRAKLNPGDNCPTCGRSYYDGPPADVDALKIFEKLLAAADQVEAAQAAKTK